MAAVVSANLTKRTALLDDGRTLPITNMIDAFGDDTNDAGEAVAFVCGAGREWFAENMDDFERATVQ